MRTDRLALYDPRLRDVVVKTLALKAQWQAELLGNHGARPLVFIDEPVLAGFGSSAFISVSADDIRAMLEEVVHHIHEAGDWLGCMCVPILIGRSFSGHPWMSLTLTPIPTSSVLPSIRGTLFFSEQGRGRAWGLVPTTDDDSTCRETADSLAGSG